MPTRLSSALVFWILTVRPVAAASPADWKITPAIARYCHFVRFAQGWQIDFHDSDGTVQFYDYSNDYEFRAADESRTVFLVAGWNDSHESYTTNKYLIDLADPAGVARPAAEPGWKAARLVPLFRKQTFGPLEKIGPNDVARSNGHEFRKTGANWGWDLLSPHGDLLVLLSWTGKVDKRAEYDFPFSPPWKYHGKLFLEVFNTITGEKILTVEGRYQGGWPTTGVQRSAWLTDRFFIIPTGEHNERCLVCDFGETNKGVQP